jgi:4-azaleucine resistance transporter AzlC
MKNPSDTSAQLKALAPAIPVVMGYVPVGFAFGVLAANAGMPPLTALLMSLLVFAGSAQLMSVGFIAQGLNPWAIIATTFIVNLRHLLMSASLSTHMRQWKPGEVAGFCYELTDETFAVHSLRFEQGDTSPSKAMRINLVCQSSWIAGTALGVLAGGLITDVKPFALDYALPAMFIALLVLQIRGKVFLWVALAGAALSMLLWGAGLTQWHVILAAVIAAALGAGVETWQKRR